MYLVDTRGGNFLRLEVIPDTGTLKAISFLSFKCVEKYFFLGLSSSNNRHNTLLKPGQISTINFPYQRICLLETFYEYIKSSHIVMPQLGISDHHV